MTLSERDRKIMILIVPLILVAAYWFLVLAPKREEAATAKTELQQQEERRDAAKASAQTAVGAQGDFQSDFTEIVRLGKAIPASVDMPSLIVQLDRAAEGTGIRFTKIATGDRTTAATATPPATPPATPAPSTGSSPGSTPVQAGGQTAQSAPGAAAESANNAAQTSDQRNAAASSSGVAPSDAQTSTTNSSGSLPVGGGAAGATPAAAGSTSGLETVPLDLEFVGDFFNLADFFHDVKRFVRVANRNVLVGGRLITVEGVNWTSKPELFPRITAELQATVYLSPKIEGATAGATPQGPAAATTPVGGTDTAAVPPAPTATATP